ncbi:agmatine deiminase family protein [Rhodococcus sp. MALMAid1271]|uniref:agmatine deiminase family protein n=1 Tax=Rhodococcus sp. MALMAid1271 TaxID=3411744 RepID=UPI003B9E2713
MSTAATALTMPSETAPQDKVWMAFPCEGYSLGVSEQAKHEARSTWAAVAHAVAEFEPVTVVVDPAERGIAATYLSRDIDVVEAPLNDAWMRDIGPTFVHAEDGSIAAVDWIFNGWGAQDWAQWDRDCKIGEFVADQAAVQRITSPIVNEGGGIAVDGAGTVLVTETVQLDPGRNPTLSKADIEAELTRTIGAQHVIWLPRGLTRDSMRFGTRGHVDIVAAIPSPGTVLVHRQRDASHPDHEVSALIIDTFRASHNGSGGDWNIVEVPAPQTLRDDDGFVDYSYINHLVVNGGVIACSYGDPMDEEATAILRDAYPGRKVVTVDARPLFERGGGIHCITQHQPSALKLG